MVFYFYYLDFHPASKAIKLSIAETYPFILSSELVELSKDELVGTIEAGRVAAKRSYDDDTTPRMSAILAR